MNAERRKALAKIADEIGVLIGKAADLKDELETLRDEEQDYYDNMPESIQAGEKGDNATAAIEVMDSVIDELDNLQGNVNVDGLTEF